MENHTNYETFTAHKVYDNEENVFVCVETSLEFGRNYVNINTNDEKSKEWYGKCDLHLPITQAKQIAHALLKLCDDSDE